MTAYYNEIDPHKAETLRLAIKAGAIAPGIVDERSIAAVDPSELARYTQCHFFAGSGFWSLALRQAGGPDDRPVWTGSCPRPSFSAAARARTCLYGCRGYSWPGPGAFLVDNKKHLTRAKAGVCLLSDVFIYTVVDWGALLTTLVCCEMRREDRFTLWRRGRSHPRPTQR
jgi:DNA (cytosine-5)-methyltransferase 1